MSARQARKGTPVSSGSTRPTSPLSPTRHSRIVEKNELMNLNDRLAAYIDRVRHLENENARLTTEITCYRDTTTREVTNIKGMYEHELSDARKLLDETSKEKAKLEIDIKRFFEENEDLKKRQVYFLVRMLVLIKENDVIYYHRKKKSIRHRAHIHCIFRLECSNVFGYI